MQIGNYGKATASCLLPHSPTWENNPQPVCVAAPSHLAINHNFLFPGHKCIKIFQVSKSLENGGENRFSGNEISSRLPFAFLFLRRLSCLFLHFPCEILFKSFLKMV